MLIETGRTIDYTAAMVVDSRPIAGVLLAAGLSTRMGRPKQLEVLRGWPLCAYAAQALAQAGHEYLLAVIPPSEVGERIRAALAEWPFVFVVNPDPARGMASSFRVAVQTLQDTRLDFAAVNFALADMPLITADIHRALLDAFRGSTLPEVGCGCGHDAPESAPSEVKVPVVLAEYGVGHDAVRAPPHLFRADLLQEVLNGPDADHGPRQLIKAHAAQGLVVRFPANLLLDVDTPQDLLQADLALG